MDYNDIIARYREGPEKGQPKRKLSQTELDSLPIEVLYAILEMLRCRENAEARGD